MVKRRLTVLGTGRMGFSLALALVAQGHVVTAWNRTASKAAPLAAKGIRVAPTVEEAVAEAEIVIGNVNDYATTTALVAPSAVTKALRNKVFVQLSTGTPRQARAAAGWAREHHIRYLDGAIMATPEHIGEPGCTVLYSGANEDFEASKSALAALGGNALYLGAEIGHANTLDAAILTVLWGSLFGTWQGAAICEAEGFPLPALADALAATMPMLDGALKDSIERIAHRRFAADASTAASVTICHASARLIHEISKEHGLHLGLTAALDKIFTSAIEAGHGADDLSAVYQSVRP